MPRDAGASDQELVGYVLGLLPEEQTARVDEAAIANDEMANRLRIVEDDLVDAYVSGAMDADTRRQFESVYMASPLRCEKIAFARRFLAAIERAVPATAPVEPAAARTRSPRSFLSGVRRAGAVETGRKEKQAEAPIQVCRHSTA